MLGEIAGVLFDIVPLPTMVFDADTLEFIAVNRAAVDHYGYSREQFATMTVVDIRPMEERATASSLIRALPVGPYPVITALHRRQDGSLINVEVTSQSLDVPHRRARLAVAADTTHRLEAETRMRRMLDAIARSEVSRTERTRRDIATARERFAETLGRAPHELLSAREREVLALVAEGLTNQQVADRITVSVKSVETYRGRLMRKLALENRAHLVRYALEHGFLVAGRRHGS